VPRGIFDFSRETDNDQSRRQGRGSVTRGFPILSLSITFARLIASNLKSKITTAAGRLIKQTRLLSPRAQWRTFIHGVLMNARGLEIADNRDFDSRETIG
jgi:hypothetical protein